MMDPHTITLEKLLEATNGNHREARRKLCMFIRYHESAARACSDEKMIEHHERGKRQYTDILNQLDGIA